MAIVTKSIRLYPRREVPSQALSLLVSDLYIHIWAPSHFTEEKMEPWGSGDPILEVEAKNGAKPEPTCVPTRGLLSLSQQPGTLQLMPLSVYPKIPGGLVLPRSQVHRYPHPLCTPITGPRPLQPSVSGAGLHVLQT